MGSPGSSSITRIVADAAGMLAAHGPIRPDQTAVLFLANVDQLTDWLCTAAGYALVFWLASWARLGGKDITS